MITSERVSLTKSNRMQKNQAIEICAGVVVSTAMNPSEFMLYYRGGNLI